MSKAKHLLVHPHIFSMRTIFLILLVLGFTIADKTKVAEHKGKVIAIGPKGKGDDRDNGDGEPPPDLLTTTTPENSTTLESITTPENTTLESITTPEGITTPENTTLESITTPEGITTPENTTLGIITTPKNTSLEIHTTKSNTITTKNKSETSRHEINDMIEIVHVRRFYVELKRNKGSGGGSNGPFGMGPPFGNKYYGDKTGPDDDKAPGGGSIGPFGMRPPFGNKDYGGKTGPGDSKPPSGGSTGPYDNKYSGGKTGPGDNKAPGPDIGYGIKMDNQNQPHPPEVSKIKSEMSNKVGDYLKAVLGTLANIPVKIARKAYKAGSYVKGILYSATKPPTDKEPANIVAFKKSVLNKYQDTTLNFSEIVLEHGYPSEEYEVKTDDGYLLTFFRIPHGINQTGNSSRPVAFLMHGFIDSSDAWILAGPNKSLAYILADNGFDVWVGNSRGNRYSRKHVSLDPNLKSFWRFSWDEIGEFDLPAMIDFALKTTNHTKLYYIGHSQGTTEFLVMCSLRPEYNSKIHKMIALAPVAWTAHMTSPIIRFMAPGSFVEQWVAETFSNGEFLPKTEAMAVAGGALCKDHALTQELCCDAIFLMTGFNLKQFNASLLPIIVGHYPAGSSFRQFSHCGQLIISRKFARFDHGTDKNLKTYGTIQPPDYDLSLVKAPVYLFFSKNDWMSSFKDVKTLCCHLPNVVGKELMADERCQHSDYLWSKDVDILNYKILHLCSNNTIT